MWPEVEHTTSARASPLGLPAGILSKSAKWSMRSHENSDKCEWLSKFLHVGR